MALTPRSGFSITTSGPNDTPSEIPNTQVDVLNNMPYVTDTNLNKYAIDSSSYPNTSRMMVGFIKGKRTSVTYYRLLRQGGSNIRSNIADYPTTRDILNTEYQKIINLEITLPHGFEFNVNNQNASVSITGQAYLYPGMNASVGDIFLTGTGDGRIGLFQVSSVTPMSWRTDRIYVITFILQSFADASDIETIDSSVSITHIFSKDNYLGGTSALLSETTYLNLQKIKAVRSNLCKYYHSTFFDTSLCSFVRPDGLYDAMIVQFMSQKITMDDIPIKAKNLLGKFPETYNQSIWARLIDRYNTTLHGVSPYVSTNSYQETRMGVFVTELYGRSILLPTSDVDIGELYIFSENFYTGNQVDMSNFELLIYNAITLRTVGDLSVLIADYLDTIYLLSTDDQFYRIPLYIQLIDMALQSQYREIDAPSMNYASTGE